jgi:tetratricopeptide (TPR) repeat protein
MDSLTLIERLNSVLPKSQAGIILAAIRHDPVVWENLHDEAFFEQVLSADFPEPEKWAPGVLGLIKLNLSGVLFSNNQVTIDLEAALKKRASDQLKIWAGGESLSSTLEDVDLVALAIREHRQTANTWDKFIEQIILQNNESIPTTLQIWQTPLACVFSLISDAEDFLSAIWNERTQLQVEDWLLHIIFSNPITVNRQAQITANLLRDSSMSEQVGLLRKMIAIGRENTASATAVILLDAIRQSLPRNDEQVNWIQFDYEHTTARIMEWSSLAELFRISGDMISASVWLQRAQSAIDWLQVGVGLQQLQVNPMDDELRKSIAPAASKLMESDPLRSEAQLVGAVDVKEGSSCQHPLVDLEMALKGQNSDKKAETCHKAAQRFVNAISNGSEAGFPRLASWQPSTTIRSLASLGLIEDAALVAQKLLKYFPMDRELLEAGLDANKQAGRWNDAIQDALVLNTFEPTALSHLRSLAEIWEQQAVWDKAYKYRQDVVKISPSPAADDLIACANAALEAGDKRDAVESCNSALKLEPEHGMAHAMLGRIKFQAGENEQAIKYLSKATLLSPEEARGWLWLAEVQQANGDSIRSMETLRAAVLANPNSAEVLVALSRACTENGQSSEALPYLRKAAELAPSSEPIAIQLASSLKKIGRGKEALQYLETTRKNWPLNPDLAFMQAELFLAQKEYDKAISPMEVALQAKNCRPAWHLVYAQALMGDPAALISNQEKTNDINKLQMAKSALERVLLAEPENHNAKLLLAEVLRRNGDSRSALDLYRSLTENSLSVDEDEQWRLKAGLGLAALDCGEFENALSAMEEAVQRNPEYLVLHHFLAKGFLEAGMQTEAKNEAETALQKAPANLDNLVWYVEFMQTANSPAEANEAIRTALQLVPNDAHVISLASKIQLENGNKGEALQQIQKLFTIQDASERDVLSAINTSVQNNEFTLALQGLQRLENLVSDESIALKVAEAAMLYQAGQLDDAIASLEQITQVGCPVGYPYLIQGELLIEAKRTQAAEACLNHALQLFTSPEQELALDTNDPDGNYFDLFPHTWKQLTEEPQRCHLSLTKAFLAENNPSAALRHARQALEYWPANLELRILVVDLMQSLLLEPQPLGIMETDGDANSDTDTGYDWLVLKSWIAWTNADKAVFHETIQSISDNGGSKRSALFLKAMDAWEQGDYDQVENCYQQASQMDLEDEFTQGWLGNVIFPHVIPLEAAVLLQRWEDAQSIGDTLRGQFQNNIQVHYRYALSMIRLVESERFLGAVGVRRHTPGQRVFDTAFVEKIDSSLQNINGAVLTEKGVSLQKRGQMLLQPTSDTVSEFTRLAQTEEELSSLGCGLCILGNNTALETIYSRHNHNIPLLAHKAVCLLVSSPEASLEAAVTVLEQSFNRPEYHALAAIAAFKAGKVEQALGSLENAIQIWTDEPIWMEWEAQWNEDQGLVEQSAAAWEKAVELQPEKTENLISFAHVLVEKQDFVRSIRILEQARAQDPECIELHELLAKAYMGNSRSKEALQSAEDAMRLSPKSLSPVLLGASIALYLDILPKARDYATQAVKLAPSNVEAVVLLSNVIARQEGPQAGLDFLNKCKEHGISGGTLTFAQARLIHDIHGVNVALPVAETAVMEGPENVAAINFLAELQHEIGLLERAESTARRSLALEPNQAPVQALLGRVSASLGLLDQSVQAYSNAIRLQPDHIGHYLGLGDVYQSRREYTRAIEVFNMAAQVNPENPQPFYQAAMIMKEGKDYVGAESMLRRALELAPHDVNINRQLGVVVTLNLVHNPQEVH